MSRASYKRYKIETLQRDEGSWTARIFAPGTHVELVPAITATDSEGEMVLLRRAYEAVDKDLASQR